MKNSNSVKVKKSWPVVNLYKYVGRSPMFCSCVHIFILKPGKSGHFYCREYFLSGSANVWFKDSYFKKTSIATIAKKEICSFIE